MPTLIFLYIWFHFVHCWIKLLLHNKHFWYFLHTVIQTTTFWQTVLFQLLWKTVDCTGGTRGHGVELRSLLTPLENPLCVYAVVAVALMTEGDSLFWDLVCRVNDKVVFTWTSSSPWMILVVISCFPLSFLVKFPFIISPSRVHEPCGATRDTIRATAASRCGVGGQVGEPLLHLLIALFHLPGCTRRPPPGWSPFPGCENCCSPWCERRFHPVRWLSSGCREQPASSSPC